MSELKKVFDIAVKVDKPIVVGMDKEHGRRQLIPILSGTLTGPALEEGGKPLSGIVLPGGVDSQIIHPNGICDLSARYGVRFDDGSSMYIENNGIRTVPEEYAQAVYNGEFIDPSLYYFCTKPNIEIYDERLTWITRKLLVCTATRLPDEVRLSYFTVEP